MIIECEWGREDCKFLGERCEMCFTDSQCYSPKPIRKAGLAKRAQKADGRMGSQFEFQNHKRNESILKNTISGMTLNSGATVIQKGDEQITGYIRVMEELKTRVAEQAPGKKTFTIQKKWLDKLAREAPAENMEFWYLKFKFHESENDCYVIVDQDTIMSMIYTMSEDRKAIDVERNKATIENKRRELAEAELLVANKKIELLEARLKSVTGAASPPS